MPLGTREVLVAIRARDVTSRVLREIGTNFSLLGGLATTSGRKMFETGAALTAVGVGMAGVGAVGLKFFNDSINSFIEYSRQAALTKTQVDDLGVSVSDLGEIGKRVASRIPAPFNEMQDALYDIFSSTNANVTEAEKLLEQFAKGAVAGQTDIRTAARATISIMNAYQIPFSKASDVMDIMFRLVQKGVGTYEEFNSAIGRAIPAAVSAGQSFETLAGMMAFLTKNGLSTQMAATSAARALELFSKPDKFKALEELGITVRDSNGRFLQMNDIITQLANNEGWAKMTEPKRKEMFEDIFGTGTIQARRFFDIAIPNFGELNTLTSTMQDSAGALEGAYNTMFSEPAMQAQLLKNKYEILRVEIGEKLIPTKLKLIEAASKLIDWWNSLSDSTQSLIVRFAAGAAAFLTVSGVVITLVGAFMMLAGVLGGVGAAFAVVIGVPLALAAGIAAAVAAFKAFGGGIRGVIAAIAAAIAAISAFGAAWVTVGALIGGIAVPVIAPILAIVAVAIAAALLIWKNWNTVVDIFHTVVDAIKSAWQWFSNLSLAGKLLVGIIVALTAPFVLVIAAIVALIKNFDSVIDAVKGVWEWFNNLHMAGKILIGIITAIAAPFLLVIAAGVSIVKNWSTVVQWARNLVDAAKGVFDWFMNLNTVFRVIIGAIGAILAPFIAAIGVVVALGAAIYRNWGTIKNATIAVWSVVVDAVDAAWSLIKRFWDWFTNIDLDVWGTIKETTVSVWNTVKSIVGTTIDAVVGAVKTAADAIVGPLQTAWGWLQEAFNWFSDHFGEQFAEIWNTLTKEVGDVLQELGETFSALWQDAKNFWDNIKSAGGEVVAIFSPIAAVVGALASLFGEAFADAFGTFMDGVREVIKFFAPSMKILKDGFVAVVDVIVTVVGHLVDVFGDKWNLAFAIVKTAVEAIVNVIRVIVEVIISIWNNFSGVILRITESIWNFIADIVSAAIKIVSNVIQLVLNVIQGDWGEAWNNIKDILGGIWDTIVALVRAGISTLITVFVDIPMALAGVAEDLIGIAADIGGDLIQGLIDGARAVWDALFELGRDIVTGVIDTIKSLFGISSPSTVMMEIGMDVIQGMFDGFILVWNLVLDWISGWLDVILGLLSSAGTWLLDIGKSISNGLWTGIKFIWDHSLIGWFLERKDKFLDFFAGALDWLIVVGKNVLSGLWTGIKFIWYNYIFGWFSERKQKFLDFFANAINWLPEVGKNVLRGLWSGIKAIWDISIAGWFTGSDGGGGISGKFKGFFTNAVNWLKNAGRDIINGLKSGIKSVVDNMGDWISDRVDDIVDAFKSFFGISSPSKVMMDVGKNFILGFMEGVVMQAKNIPALISKIGMGAVDILKYLYGNIFGEITTGTIGDAFFQAMGQQMAAAYGWGGLQWNALKELWNRESGWNPNALNPSSGAYGIPQCVDLDTKILTRRGWLNHDEVVIGDETIGYNQETGVSEWTVITNVLHPGPAELCRFGISRWSARSTVNHRWLMERMVNDYPRYEEMVELGQNKGRGHRIVLSRKSVTASSIDISLREAALLGWIAGDGWLQKAHNRSPWTYNISQTKTENFESIMWSLGDDPNPRMPYVYENDKKAGHTVWGLSAPYARDLTKRAGNPKTNSIDQVLRMSTSQRAAWLNAIIGAEGYEGDGYLQISQSEGSISDAIKLAVYLNGNTPSVYRDERYEKTCLTIGITEPYIGLRNAKFESIGIAEVWCVTTDLGTWTAEQDGNVFLTGNSLPASKMGPLAQASNPDIVSRAQAQIKWGLNYIADRYGSPLAALAWHNAHNWYAKGAWEVPYTGLAGIHKGEMIIPKTFAGELRSAMSGTGGNGANFNFYGDVAFGSDMYRATSDLDFWARTQQSGV